MRLLTLLAIFFTTAPAMAQVPNVTVEQKEFITLYAEIAKEADPKKYLTLIHPEVRQCMSKNLVQFEQNNFVKKAKHLKQITPRNMVINQINLAESKERLRKRYRDKAFYAVEPKHILNTILRVKETSRCGIKHENVAVEIEVAFYNGRWYEVLDCGKNDLGEFLGKQLVAKAVQEERNEALYQSIPSEIWENIEPVLLEDKELGTKMLQTEMGLSIHKARDAVERYCADK